MIADARSKASAEVQAAKRETDQEIEEAAAAKKKVPLSFRRSDLSVSTRRGSE